MPKRILPLSESQVESAQPKSKDYKLSDGFGLHLLVTTAGGKLWRFQYRHMGKQKLLALGVYPTVSLAVARDKRGEARKQLAEGLDPSMLKKMQKVPEASSFEVVTREWHERYKPQWSERHAGNLLTRLEYDVFPFIGNIAISEIKTSDLLAVLSRLQVRTLATAERIKTALGQIFRYAVETGRVVDDPTETLRGSLPSKGDRYSAPTMNCKAIAALLLAIDGYQGASVVKCAMQLTPLLLVEPGDLCHAKWEEIDFQKEVWTMPAESAGIAQSHIVPLARQSYEILRRLNSLTRHSRYVFPSLRTSLRCMSPNAIYAALNSIGLTNDVIAGNRFWEAAGTFLAEGAKVSSDVIELQLKLSKNQAAYDPMQFLPQRHEMMQKWADYLDELKNRGGDTVQERIDE
ncbi:tyrosine-type recombinase/integrase [Geomonas azotofigens]|uniref:tyrosine-type recombinase/integrase n=1 Tax=Geomonas azotofigens TaxID=2843196 RepID=UPI001C1153D1|nr:integrase arm-type DNA-binding domain-containing protein [Geomonas azotofigens]MBU5613804.1 integrase arm-type DNA-binding domain-containing protein [Geomonas azotofigens]